MRPNTSSNVESTCEDCCKLYGIKIGLLQAQCKELLRIKPELAVLKGVLAEADKLPASIPEVEPVRKCASSPP